MAQWVRLLDKVAESVSPMVKAEQIREEKKRAYSGNTNRNVTNQGA